MIRQLEMVEVYKIFCEYDAPSLNSKSSVECNKEYFSQTESVVSIFKYLYNL